DGAYRRFNRVGRTESQSACERNCSRSRKAKREYPSSGKPAHEKFDTPRGCHTGRMRRLADAVWAQAWFKPAHSGGIDRTIGFGISAQSARAARGASVRTPARPNQHKFPLLMSALCHEGTWRIETNLCLKPASFRRRYLVPNAHRVRVRDIAAQD